LTKSKIAIIGTQGLPNNYGGFEALVENLVEYLGNDFEITVWCSSRIYKIKPTNFKKAKLKYLPIYANGPQSILYDIISIILSLNYDKILILGASGGIIFPLLFPYKKKIILNFGGLDWQRSKWNPLVKRFLKLSEMLAVKNAAILVADNERIQSYIKNEYKLDSVLIEYGGDQATSIPIEQRYLDKYPFLMNKYAFSLARIQPDNNVSLILDSFELNNLYPIIFIGNWANSEYGKSLKKKYNDKPNIVLLDAIYDTTELNLLRSNCTVYIHGHSAGGTNPSLVEAMFLGLPIIAFSNGFNEFTTESKAIYFKNTAELKITLQNLDEASLVKLGNEMKEIAARRYKWEIISRKYKELF